ncbi:MAG: nucleotidyltransferase domain-containing protein [bacterium]
MTISFKSKITHKLLNYFFLNKDSSSYINELAKALQIDPKNTDRKLKELEVTGILKSEFKGKQRYFSLNTSNPLTEHYKEIFLKTFGFEQNLKDQLAKIKNIKEVIIFGSYAKQEMDEDSDIDLLIVGNHRVIEVQTIISALQQEISREINTINITSHELAEKIAKNDPFIHNIFNNKHIRLI